MKKIIFTIIGLFIVGVYSCNDKEFGIIDNQATETAISTRAQMDIELMCEQLVSSPEFAEFGKLLENVGMKLYSEKEKKLDMNIDNMDELMVWVKQNIKYTAYKNISEFEKDVEKLYSIAQPLRLQYSDIFLNNNIELLKAVALKEALKKPSAIPYQAKYQDAELSADCIGDMWNCLQTAVNNYDGKMPGIIVMGIFCPLCALGAWSYAYNTFQDEKKVCEKTAYDCLGLQAIDETIIDDGVAEEEIIINEDVMEEDMIDE
ncbi:MAG: hypothetical protein FWH23_00090 [Bacteroidales bacterium]|nr:hypothetical protein [Bacteroidales bacterium]